MNNISSFFGKIFKNLSQKEDDKKTILNILNTVSNNSLSVDNIKINNQEVFISCHPLIKQEIIFKKDEILNEINTIVNTKITNLR